MQQTLPTYHVKFDVSGDQCIAILTKILTTMKKEPHSFRLENLNVKIADESTTRVKFSKDYCCATDTMSGEKYIFTPFQSATVKLLHEANLNGTPYLRGDWLLEEIDADSKRVDDLFKGHVAWNTLIKKGPRQGTFFLDI